MKAFKFLGLALTAMLFLLFTSCESSDDSDDMNEVGNTEEVKASLTAGSWEVALFEEDGVDQTSYFTGYSFVFEATGELIADNGETSISGAWSITSESNSDDDSSSDDDVDFKIYFASSAKFAEISEDWEIVSYSSSRIELKHVSGGDGSIDRLVLEKI